MDVKLHKYNANLNSDTVIIGNDSKRESGESEGIDSNSDDEGNDDNVDNGVNSNVNEDADNALQMPETKRGPKLIRTGRPERPRKQYATVISNATQERPNTECNAVPYKVIEIDNNDEWFDACSNMCTSEVSFTQAISGKNKKEF
ncbi:uncharacterized protein LOC118644772 [Monomorium pharaonis]|uniref:uncharacterized protein LOC118644772 n=1 Tax=Monomorium pharaonis TaxID=307658 RepID=UPI00174673EC|nr:uncharacterized protein LOC118644772 [Monomorium pharaonis]